MSSRRLAIANLLNGPQPTTNDDILAEEVVLAPHLRKQPPTPTPAPAPAHRYDPVHDLLNVRAKPPSPPPLPQDVDQWLLEQYEPSTHDHHHVEDPDIDHAVSELVDEPPPAPSVLQPDVDDELLSLVDDQPKPAAPPKKPPAKKKAKPGPKPKARTSEPSKPRAKPGPKPKPRDQDGNIIPPPPPVSRKPSNKQSAAPSRAVSNAATASRSRSTSVLPATAPEPTEEPDPGQPDKEDDKDKLYCVCETKYDEDKSMIACDKCDEWYHTQCINIPDHQVDLIDQFFCPPCIAKNPNADLKTTYKTRCLYGLDHPDPTSPKSCHKPARAFSKYCSDECGVSNLRKRIDVFAKKGGDKDELWQAVKNAEKRQGLVKCVKDDHSVQVITPTQGVKQKEMNRLDKLLDDIQKMREELDRGLDIILWREKLISLASGRAEKLSTCGWDQRLCFSDEDWAEYGEGVLDTYEDQAMEVDEEGEWWCPGNPDCERHCGWQNLRLKELDKEKGRKEDALARLTSKEREIRKRIEDTISDSINHDGDEPAESEPVQKQPAGSVGKGKTATVNGDVPKKGKKRKAPS